MFRVRANYVTVTVLGLLTFQSTLGQTDLSKFPLTQGIPADVFVAVAHRANPERQFLHDHWARVWTAFHESGVLNDVWELITDMMGDEEAEKMEEITSRFHELCSAVDWDALFRSEMVHAGRFVTPFTTTPYEGIILGRSDPAKVTANYAAIKAVLEELVKLASSNGEEGAVTVHENKSGDYTAAVLTPTAAPGVGIGIGKWKDVLVIGFGGLNLMEESVNLLKESSKAKGLTSTDRFKQAFAKLPPAEDEFSFVAPSEILVKTKAMFAMIIEAKNRGREAAKTQADKKNPKVIKDESEENGEEADEEAEEEQEDAKEAAILGMMVNLMDELSIIDTIATVEWTDGLRVHMETRTSLRSDAKTKAMTEVMAGGKPIESFERFIPKGAKNFSVSSGINWRALYRFARDFFQVNVPDSEKLLAKFDRMQKEELDLDIEKDIIGMLAGGHISVETANDMAFFVRLTDETKAQELLDRLFTTIQEHTGEKGGGLMVTPVEIAGHKGFRQVSHPMMMMMGGGMTPVVGCAEGHLVLATNSKIVKLCLDTAAGKNPNITKNARWQKEALRPGGGKLDSISFEDQSGMAEQIQGAIGGFSMALGMVGMFGQDMPPQMKSFFSKLPPILAKMGPVAGKLDFYASTSSYGTFENGVWHERSVQNYKPPRPPEAEEAEEDADAAAESKPRKKNPSPKSSEDKDSDEEE